MSTRAARFHYGGISPSNFHKGRHTPKNGRRELFDNYRETDRDYSDCPQHLTVDQAFAISEQSAPVGDYSVHGDPKWHGLHETWAEHKQRTDN